MNADSNVSDDGGQDRSGDGRVDRGHGVGKGHRVVIDHPGGDDGGHGHGKGRGRGRSSVSVWRPRISAFTAPRGRGATALVRGEARASGRWASGRTRTAPSAGAAGPIPFMMADI